MEQKLNLKKAIVLASDNFTPLSRTPWAGHRICSVYKEGFLAAQEKNQKVGESWEFSCDKTFPSRLQEYDLELSQLIDQNRSAVMSASKSENSCELLVKIIDTASPLSLQLHPHDSDPALKSDECGKPESWLVLHAEEGAGIFLGFKKAINADALRSLLLSNDRDEIADFMHFIPVKANEYFEIKAGTPHAIGAGLTLIEPQRVLESKTGVTYRMWDWCRKYNKSGQPDADFGEARPLHLEHCLRILDPAKSGPKMEAEARKEAKVVGTQNLGEVFTFAANDYYQTHRAKIAVDGELSIELREAYGVVVNLKSDLKIVNEEGEETLLLAGQTALLPSESFPLRFKAAKNSPSDFVLIHSPSSVVEWS